ncbi:hypothetical protein H0H92_001649 [Tricholoma furcatifolium]|nr:hypothetical protein H0H92_001649 [Tricholoma furcatifolium]
MPTRLDAMGSSASGAAACRRKLGGGTFLRDSAGPTSAAAKPPPVLTQSCWSSTVDTPVSEPLPPADVATLSSYSLGPPLRTPMDAKWEQEWDDYSGSGSGSDEWKCRGDVKTYSDSEDKLQPSRFRPYAAGLQLQFSAHDISINHQSIRSLLLQTACASPISSLTSSAT